MTDNNLRQSTVLALCEATLNRLLRLDPASMQRMAALSGRVLHISVTQPNTDCYLLADKQGLILQGTCEQPGDCHISGTAAALFTFLTCQDIPSDLDSLNISVSGDGALADEIQALITDLEIDWEALLAPWTGDIAAHEIGQASRAALSWGQAAMKSIRLNLQEYLQEEFRLLPPRGEVNYFYQQLDQLTQDTGQFTARLSRLSGEPPPHHREKETDP